MGRLASADVFPVKGMRRATTGGEALPRVTATRRGLEHQGVGDRQLYVVGRSQAGELTVITPRGRDEATGREHVHPGDRALKTADVDITGKRQVQLSAPGVGSLAIDLARPPQGESVRAALHRGEVWGFDLGPEATEFATALTGRPWATIMSVDRTAARMVGPNQYRDALAADSRPYSLGVLTSLAELNARTPGLADVPMLRFRPNFTVDELEGFDAGALEGSGLLVEDFASRVAVGEAPFKVAAAIVRCVVTNFEEDGGVAPNGGLRVTRPRAGVRVNDQGIPEGGRPEPLFCVSLELDQAVGDRQFTIPAGAPVEVLEWAPSPNVALRGAQR